MLIWPRQDSDEENGKPAQTPGSREGGREGAAPPLLRAAGTLALRGPGGAGKPPLKFSGAEAFLFGIPFKFRGPGAEEMCVLGAEGGVGLSNRAAAIARQRCGALRAPLF